MADAAEVIEKIAGACGSSAMVVLIQYAGMAVLEAHGPETVRQNIAAGRHVTGLAFSEFGSRSHFWAPGSTAQVHGDDVRLDARTSWVTSAGEADSYVWSSRPLGEGAMTLWLVPADSAGLAAGSAQLGEDGAGLDITLGTALPTSLVLSAAFSLGLTEAMGAEAAAHLGGTRLQHLDQTLAEQPVSRAAFARLRIRTDEARAVLADTLAALAAGRKDATLRVLQVKAVASEAASEVADGVMRVCGGAAFGKELGVERRFRDSLAARVMASTTDALHDLVGSTALGVLLFGDA